MAELSPGSIFAGHRIEAVAGRGGFGVVYRATHLALDHVVALKVISSGRTGDESFRERFKSESRIAVSIRHPNVVAVHNAGEEDGLLFVTMDFVEGTDLRGLLNRERRLRPERAVAIVDQVAAALDAAHERGLVHRDIKPGNVLIEGREGSEHVFLTDFGLSKRIDATSGVTASGAFVGTLDYVAPEQIKGERVDARTDVYALGCVLFELISGQVPFAGQEEKVAKIYAHLQELPPELMDLAPDAPAPLTEVVWRAMQKDPDARHPSAGDFARAATAALEGHAPTEPERSVGVGAAAPTQAFDALGDAEPETAEAARVEPAETVRVAPGSAEAPPDGPLPPSPRRPWFALAALGVVAALAVAFVLLSGGGDGGGGGEEGADGGGQQQERPEPPAVDASTVVGVAPEPVGVATGAEAVYAASREGGALTRVVGDETARERDLPGSGEQVVVAGGAVWVSVDGGDAPGTLMRFRPNLGGDPLEIATGLEPRGIAVTDEAVWVANGGSNTVSRHSPEDGSPIGEMILVSGFPNRVVVGAGGVWVARREDGAVSRLSEDGAFVAEGIPVGPSPVALAVVGEEVWSASSEAGTVTRIDPETDQPVAAPAIEVGGTPRAIAFGFDRAWVTNKDSYVTEIGRDGEILDEHDVAGDLEGIAVDEANEGLWVASATEGDDSLHFLPADG